MNESKKLIFFPLYSFCLLSSFAVYFYRVKEKEKEKRKRENGKKIMEEKGKGEARKEDKR